MTQCVAITKKGNRCQNEAMRGSHLCGPHTDRAPTAVVEPADDQPEPPAALRAPLTTRQATAAELHRDDWVPTHVKFAGARCTDCGREVDIAELAYWSPAGRRWLHVNCYERRTGGEPVQPQPDERPERFRRIDDARRDRRRR